MDYRDHLLVASTVVYLAFMLAWLKIAVNLTNIGFVRLIIALIALIGGLINLKVTIMKEKKILDVRLLMIKKKINI